MTREVTIAAIQLPYDSQGETPVQRRAWRMKSTIDWLEKAGEAGATLACLGEMCNRIDGAGDAIEHAYSGPTATAVCALARRYQMHVVLPLLAAHEGALRNIALIIDHRGRIVGHYLKVHPTRNEMQKGIVPGDDLPVFDLAFGRVGVAICHDLSFPESTRVLALRGAEIIVWPTLWSGWGEELCYAVIKSRAIDNGAWLVTSSFGVDADQAWRPGQILGRSGVIGPDGLVLSNAGRQVGLALTTVDLDRPRMAHSFSWPEENDFWTSVLADRRPDVYGAIVDPAYVIDALPVKDRPVASVRHLYRYANATQSD